MKIIFNLLNTGLGNNGGCKTIIRSAETLQDLGHDVYICTNVNQCTWWLVRVPIIKSLLPCDVLIATGYSSVKSTINYKKANLKLWYIRAHENWITSDKNLMAGYRQLRCIANSEWIKKWLSNFDIHCDIVYPGLDFDCYYKSDQQRQNILGGLMHHHIRKRPEDCLEAHRISGYSIKMLNKDLKTGDFKLLSDFYNSIKVWISPSENEGIQNVPMEATLCGCALVLTDHFMGGTIDYAINEETCLIYPARDINAAAECIKRLMEDENLRNKLNNNAMNVLRNKIGDRTTNMKKFVNFLKRILGD